MTSTPPGATPDPTQDPTPAGPAPDPASQDPQARGRRLVDDLLDVLTLTDLGTATVSYGGHVPDEPEDAVEATVHIFQGRSQPQPHGRVFGGQVLAQAVMAAGRTVERTVGDGPARPIHSLHAYFVRPGDDTRPIRFTVEIMRDGRSFSTRRVRASQGGSTLLSMIASFQEGAPGLDHADPMPSAPEPETLPTTLEVFEGVTHRAAIFHATSRPFDIRHVEGNIGLCPGRQRSNRQKVWLRALAPLPDDPLIQAAALAYASDYVMLEPVLRRHGMAWSDPRLSGASLDHAMWFHRPGRLEDWTLFTQFSPSASGGRGLGATRIFAADGTMIASAAQEGMLRVRGL